MIEDFFRSGSAGSEFSGRLSHAASRIVNEVLVSTTDDLSDSQRAELEKEITRIFYEERVTTSFERVKSRGALELLEAASTTAGGSFGDFIYKHSTNEKFIEDMRFLRSEDLVSFAYDDQSSIKLTQLGQDVVNFKGELDFSNRLPLPGSANSKDFREFDIELGCTLALMKENFTIFETGQASRPFNEEHYVYAESFDAESITSAEGDWVRIKVESEGIFEFKAETQMEENSEVIDPLLVFYEVEDKSCKWLAFDDDSGTNLNSRISQRLQEGDYMLRVYSLNQLGRVTLHLIKAPVPPRNDGSSNAEK